MEARLLIFFLGCTSATLVLNTVMMWFAYKAFVNATRKVTETMTELERHGITKAWLATLDTSAREAVHFTEAARERIVEFEPVLGRAHQRYALSLSAMNSKLEQTADDISTGARKFRDILAKPAFSFMKVAAGVASALGSSEENEDDER